MIQQSYIGLRKTKIVLSTLLALTVGVPAHAQDSSQPAASASASASVDHARAENRLMLDAQATAVRNDMAPQIEQLLDDQAIPSATIILFDSNEILWAESFGFSNLASGNPATLDTVYNTGSTFKFVVVTAIMQLVERGELSLDAPVNQYLTTPIDDFSESGQPLTLRAMLAHRAGLPPSRPVPETDVWSRTLPPSDDVLLANLNAVEPPGERYDYCNICFPVYADIVQNVTGQSIEDYLRDEILVPAGVRYTEPFYPDARAVEAMAVPYGRVGRSPWPIAQKFLQAPYSGDAYMRPLDMVSLLQPFLSGGAFPAARLLREETVQAMMPPVFADGQISLGFLSQLEDSIRVLSWDGGIYGGSTVYQIEPNSGIGVYIASNSNGTTDILHQLARRTRELMRTGNSETDIARFPIDDHGPAMLSPNLLNGHAGTYMIDGSDLALIVRRLGNQLSLTNPAGKRLELVMTGEREGVLVSTGESVSFETSEEGTSRSLIVRGDGYEFAARRRSSLEPLP